jgi:hypothetical protein
LRANKILGEQVVDYCDQDYPEELLRLLRDRIPKADLGSTDKNDFNDFLQKRLHYDLGFRLILWTGVASATGYLAIFYHGITPLDYFERVGTSLGPIVNFLGPLGLLLCVLALMLKDLEETVSDSKISAVTRGYIGGAVRRLAGDISLWTFGALATMLCTFFIAISQVIMTAKEYAIVGSLGVTLLGMTLFTGLANVYVRRYGPTPLAKIVKKPAYITIAYFFAFAWLIGGTYIL